VGYTVIHDTPVGKIANIGCFTYPRYWNQGYVTEAMEKLFEFAFLENDVYRLATGCLTENVSAEKIMVKCGMIKEAERLNCEWHDGELKSKVEYRLLRDEWNRK